MADPKKKKSYAEIAEALENKNRGKSQMNVSIDAEVADRLNEYIKEKNVNKGDLVSAAVDLFLEAINR